MIRRKTAVSECPFQQIRVMKSMAQSGLQRVQCLSQLVRNGLTGATLVLENQIGRSGKMNLFGVGEFHHQTVIDP